MLTRVIHGIVLLFLISSSYSQSPGTLEVSRLIDNEEYQKAIDLSDSLLSQANDPNQISFLHSKKGDAYYFLGNSKKSLESYLRALELENIGGFESKQQLHETHSYTGFMYNEFGLQEKALEHYRRALELAIELNDSLEVAVAHYNISNSLLSQGQINMAMEHLLSAYEIDKIRKDTAALGFDLNGLGLAQLQYGNVDDAIKYYKESIELLNRSSGNFNSLGTRYNNLSLAFNEAEMYDSALFYNDKSIEVHSQFNDSINLAERWISRANILNSRKSPRQALTWAQKAKTYFESFERSQAVMAVNEVLINSYDLLNREREALTIVEENLSMSQSLGAVLQYHESLKQKAKLHEELGNVTIAFETQKEVALLKDSIQSIKSRRLAEELEVKYEVDKVESENIKLRLEQEIAQAELAVKNQRLTLLIAIIILVVIASGIITLTLVSRSRIKNQLLQTEINELRLQIKGLVDYKPEESIISLDKLNDVLNDPLSEREFEILELAMGEHNNNQIADRVFVSVNTVKFHLKNIYSKLGVSNRRDALRFAFQNTSN